GGGGRGGSCPPGGPGARQPVRPSPSRSHDRREIVKAILHVNRAGCAWHLLPHDFPPYQSVYGYWAAREKDGPTGPTRDLLRRRVREQAGRAGEPTAAIPDAQSVK